MVPSPDPGCSARSSADREHALERLRYWRERHAAFADLLRSDPPWSVVKAKMDAYFTPEFHEQVALPDYDLWIAVLEEQE